MSDIIDLLNTKNIHSTKKLIIEAALKLFAKNGYDDTTIEGIIQETNLSKGGVYHHFKSKEDIVESITDLYIELTKEYYLKNLKSEMTALEKLMIFSSAKQQVMKSDRKGIKSVYLDSIDPKLRISITKKSKEVFEPILVDILKEGKKTGVFKLESSEVVAHYIFALKDAFSSLSPNTLKNSKNLKAYKDESRSLISHMIGIDINQLRKKTK